MDGGNESVSGLTRNADSARPFQSVDLRGDPLRRSPPSVRCRPNFTSGAARDPLIFGPGRWSSARSLQQRLKPHTSNPQPSQRLQRPDMEGGMARVPPTDNVTPPCQVSKTKYCVSILRPPKIRCPLHSPPCVAQAHRGRRHPKPSLTRRRVSPRVASSTDLQNPNPPRVRDSPTKETTTTIQKTGCQTV
jgi:hypothetical protein